MATFCRYNIFPPEATPYLGSDESLQQQTTAWRDQRLFPEIMLHARHRFHDRDVLEIRVQRHEDIFRPRASPRERELRKDFLELMASLARCELDIPKHLQVACQEFLEIYGFVSVRWNGGGFTFTCMNGVEREGYRLAGKSIQNAQGGLERIIKAARMPPFLYKAAPP